MQLDNKSEPKKFNYTEAEFEAYKRWGYVASTNVQKSEVNIKIEDKAESTKEVKS